MAKRSPILGYNHNVRYRGLIFHVQTEDSGVLSPHLFTHLFHTGVIVSTRKLVYDAGSDEGAIKSLMQAQHKAVMKDLRRGTFDGKIDEYLGGTEGLLPRGFAEETVPTEGRASGPEITVLGDQTEPVRPFEPDELVEAGAPPEPPQSTPIQIRPDTQPEVRPPPIPGAERPPIQPRTRTAERGSTASTIRSAMPPPPPPPGELDGPTSIDSGAAVAAAVAAASNATIRTPVPRDMIDIGTASNLDSLDIMSLELDEEPDAADPRAADRERSGRNRPRDTDVVLPGIDLEPVSDGVPGMVGAFPFDARPRSAPSESVPPLPPPPAASRPSTMAGSTLPPARPVTRPPVRPAFTPPQVMSRPLTNDDARNRGDSDAVEVYAPAPPSVEAPPGLKPERVGQYSQHKRVSRQMPVVDTPRERSGAVPIPPGLGRPGNRIPTGSTLPSQRPPPPPMPRESRPTPSQPMPIPQAVRTEPSSGAREAPRSRTPTPSRTGPGPARTGSGSVPNSGVVMTRPAVIVGAPAKSAQSGRIRKAREDEGRGFGQGLISEKSLDEVILAYLSEDADDK